LSWKELDGAARHRGRQRHGDTDAIFSLLLQTPNPSTQVQTHFAAAAEVFEDKAISSSSLGTKSE